jgi:hypothetical protein
MSPIPARDAGEWVPSSSPYRESQGLRATRCTTAEIGYEMQMSRRSIALVVLVGVATGVGPWWLFSTLRDRSDEAASVWVWLAPASVVLGIGLALFWSLVPGPSPTVRWAGIARGASVVLAGIGGASLAIGIEGLGYSLLALTAVAMMTSLLLRRRAIRQQK